MCPLCMFIRWISSVSYPSITVARVAYNQLLDDIVHVNHLSHLTSFTSIIYHTWHRSRQLSITPGIVHVNHLSHLSVSISIRVAVKCNQLCCRCVGILKMTKYTQISIIDDKSIIVWDESKSKWWGSGNRCIVIVYVINCD